MAWEHIPQSEDVRLGRAKLPPAYRVVWCDDHTLWLAPDGRTEGALHWNKWASFRGAWKHYNNAQPPHITEEK